MTIAGQVVALGEEVTGATISSSLPVGSITNAQLANKTISGVALGAELNFLRVDDSSLKFDNGTTFSGAAERTISIKSEGVTNDMLKGFIANTKLQNNKVTIAGQDVALGTAISADAIVTQVNNGVITNVQLANNTMSIAGQDVALGGTITAKNIANALPAGELLNSQLLNSQMTIAGQLVSLGGTITAKNIANALPAGELLNSQLQNSTISGVALGSTLNSLQVDDVTIQLNEGTEYTGSASRLISIKDDAITNAKISNNTIENAKLVNKSMTIAGLEIPLGGTITPAQIRASLPEATIIPNNKSSTETSSPTIINIDE